MSHIGVPQPRLPFEPLRRVVEARMPASAWRPGVLADIGWDHHSWQANAWRQARAAGEIPLTTADRLACDLGMHPAEIWGDDWWQAAAPGVPDDQVSLVTLAGRLRSRGVLLAQMPTEVQEHVREQWRRDRQRRRERETA